MALTLRLNNPFRLQVRTERKDLTMKQTFTSAATSINSKKLPALYTIVMKNFGQYLRGWSILDVGGGKFDNGKEAMSLLGCSVSVYDPYNRSEEENAEALSRKYPCAFLSNVLNVIDSKEARKEVLTLCRKHSIFTFITVYEGDRSGIGRQTGKDSWQENRKLSDYMAEIEEVFPYVIKRNGYIIAASDDLIREYMEA